MSYSDEIEAIAAVDRLDARLTWQWRDGVWIGNVQYCENIRAFEAFHDRDGWIVTATTLEAVLEAFERRR